MNESTATEPAFFILIAADGGVETFTDALGAAPDRLVESITKRARAERGLPASISPPTRRA